MARRTQPAARGWGRPGPVGLVIGAALLATGIAFALARGGGPVAVVVVAVVGFAVGFSGVWLAARLQVRPQVATVIVLVLMVVGAGLSGRLAGPAVYGWIGAVFLGLAVGAQLSVPRVDGSSGVDRSGRTDPGRGQPT